jgi:hypothetical protein
MHAGAGRYLATVSNVIAAHATMHCSNTSVLYICSQCLAAVTARAHIELTEPAVNMIMVASEDTRVNL